MKHLEKRGGMHICPFNYDTLIAYIFGYDACCSTKNEESPFDGMHELTHCRLGKQTNLVWPAVIKKLLTTNEVDAIKLVFSFYWDLETIKSDKGIEWLKAEFDRLGGFKKKRQTDLVWPKNIKHNKTRVQVAGSRGAID